MSDYPTAQTLAIALGNDLKHNYRRRELPWYALWNIVLRRFERLDSCCLSPQYPLWLLDLEDDDSSSHSQTDIEMASDDQGGDSLIALQHVLGKSRVYANPSLSPPSSPLAHKSGPMVPLLPTPSPPHPPPTQPLPPMTKDESHKVTDFAILHLRNRYNPRTREREILDVIIPVITEIKTYRRLNDNDDDTASWRTCWESMEQAQQAATIQVQYLFSGRRQSSVIAIAAAGPFWTWRQFFKADAARTYGNLDDADYIPSDDVVDSTRETEWSDYLYIGKDKSDITLEGIQAWAEAFIKPFNSEVLILHVSINTSSFRLSDTL